jgi:hypothetical protein
VNFTAYQEIKKFAHRMQPEITELPSYQVMAIGLISGAMGPFSNAPIDTIKTRTRHVVFMMFRSNTKFGLSRITEGNSGTRNNGATAHSGDRQ